MCEGVNWGVIKKTLQNRFLGFLWGRQLRRLAGECFREVRVYNGNRRPATLEQKGIRCLAQGRPCVSIKDQAYCPWCWEVHFDKAIHHVFLGVWVSNILNEVYFNCNFDCGKVCLLLNQSRCSQLLRCEELLQLTSWQLPFIADSISLGFYFFIAVWALSNRDVHFSVF